MNEVFEFEVGALLNEWELELIKNCIQKYKGDLNRIWLTLPVNLSIDFKKKKERKS